MLLEAAGVLALEGAEGTLKPLDGNAVDVGFVGVEGAGLLALVGALRAVSNRFRRVSNRCRRVFNRCRRLWCARSHTLPT